MESAELDQVAIDIASADGKTMLRTTGSVVKFAGFLSRLPGGPRRARRRMTTAAGACPISRPTTAVKAGEVKPEQHFTQPPPRYSEASLIKRLEELGIGRPSTYTSILQTLEDRNYVRLEKKRLIPEDRGRMVTAFLTNFFDRYVQYGFTADLEEKLDDISGGRAAVEGRAARLLDGFQPPASAGQRPGRLDAVDGRRGQLPRFRHRQALGRSSTC